MKFLLLLLLISNVTYATENISKITDLRLFTNEDAIVDATEVVIDKNSNAVAKNITARFEKGTLKGKKGTYDMTKNEIILNGNVEIDFIGKILSEKIYFYPKRNLIYTNNDTKIESGNISIITKNLSIDTKSMIITLKNIKIKNKEKIKKQILDLW